MSGRSDRHRDGTIWEDMGGYARSARRGSRIEVSGTTASSPDGSALALHDTAAQTEAALLIAVRAVEALGGRIDDVIRTRIFLAPGADWEQAAAAHKAVLGSIEPANTIVYVHGLIGDGHLVEVEVEAEVLDAGARP